MKKKTAAIVAGIVLVLLAAALAVVLVIRNRNPYQGDFTITDEEGQVVEDVSSLKAGDVIYVSLVMRGDQKETELTVTGLQATLTAEGVTYNQDGLAFDEVAAVSYKEQLVNKTITVDFLYYDLGGGSVTVSNPCTIGTCSFTVTDPETASVKVTTGLVYPADSNAEYVITME